MVVAAAAPFGYSEEVPYVKQYFVGGPLSMRGWRERELGPGGYDVPLCKSHIEGDAECRAGCRVRLSCPTSQTYPRDPQQTAFHMEAFHPS